MMNIGNTQISTFYVGSSAIREINLGEQPVWSNIDTDALQYMTAIFNAGVDDTHLDSLGFPMSFNDTQKVVSSTIKALKNYGVWSKFIYWHFPVWGIPAANRIDIVSLSSGEYKNNVQHARGYTRFYSEDIGYFRTIATVRNLKLTPSSAYTSVLLNTALSGDGAILGARGATSNSAFYLRRSLGVFGYYCMSEADGSYAKTLSAACGIITGNRLDNDAYISQRTQTTWAVLSSEDIPERGVSPIREVTIGAANISTIEYFIDCEIGSIIFGLDINRDEDEFVSEQLKNMWETITGLQLPTCLI